MRANKYIGKSTMRTHKAPRSARGIFQRGSAVGLLTALMTMANAATPPTLTPGIPGEGAMHPFPDAAHQPKNNVTYKVDLPQRKPRHSE